MEDPNGDLCTPLLLGGHDSDVILDIDGERRPAGEPENPFEFLGAPPLVLPRPIPVDPFRNHTPSIAGVYEWFKVVLCVPIALVRLVLFGLALTVGFVATKLALQGWKDKQSPMPRWRSRIMWVTRICARCILFTFGYHWIKRIGRPASREVAPIVVANHISYIEPIFFFYELFPTIVASESHDALPFVGTIIRAMQVIYVDRFSAPSRKHAVSEIKRKASCNGFPRVLLFPEGTTTNGRFLISFQLGAFIHGFPVQPVVVRFPHVHFDQSWGNISLMKLMFRMFTQFHNFMEVEYLPIIAPLVKQQNAVHFAERTSYAMASTLNIVQTSHSYGDLMLMTRALELAKDLPYNAVNIGLNVKKIIKIKSCYDQRVLRNPKDKCSTSNYMVEMAWVESSFSISTSEAMELLDQFFTMHPDSNGRVEIHGFLSAFGLGLCPLCEKIFGYFDVEKLGAITFHQFLIGSAQIRKQPLFWRACETAFNKCRDMNTDQISERRLGDITQSILPSTSENLEHLFHILDIDNDGLVGRDDFMTCLRKNPLLIALFAAAYMKYES